MEMLEWVQRVFNHEWSYNLITLIPQARYANMTIPAFTHEGMEYIVFVGYRPEANDYVTARVWRSTIERGYFEWDSGHYKYAYADVFVTAHSLARL